MIIRSMISQDITAFPAAFKLQGWDKPTDQYEQYYKEQQAGDRVVVVAEIDGEVAGYLTILPKPSEGPFISSGYPEICDFNVLIRFQRQGVGSALLDYAEGYAKERADGICLGVGLHYGYGSAQRMYVKRGYIPDGSGVWYNGERLEQYASCANDDGLTLYLSKRLSC